MHDEEERIMRTCGGCGERRLLKGKNAVCDGCKAERQRLAGMRRKHAGESQIETPPHIVERIEQYAAKVARGERLFEPTPN